MAGKIATLDNLSGGRVVLAVGLGATDTGFIQFGEVTDRKTRAELVDEHLEIMTGLWRGQPFSFTGKHYTVQPCDFMPPPPPVQQPRVPIWVVGVWGKPKSMARVLKYDGWLPTGPMPDVIAFRAQHGAGIDIVVEGTTPGDDPVKLREMLTPWRDAGATWWLEANWSAMADTDPIVIAPRSTVVVTVTTVSVYTIWVHLTCNRPSCCFKRYKCATKNLDWSTSPQTAHSRRRSWRQAFARPIDNTNWHCCCNPTVRSRWASKINLRSPLTLASDPTG